MRSDILKRPLSWAPPVLLLSTAFILHVMDWNSPLFLLINLQLGSRVDASLWQMLTILGDGYVMLALLLPLQRSQPKLVLTAVLAGVLAGIAVHLFKYGLDLPRPPAVFDRQSMNLIGPGYKHSSFPSGHSSTLFAVLSVLALGMQVRQRRLLLALLSLLAALAAISRTGVGVHWPVDVLAGAATGWLSGIAAHLMLTRFEPGERLTVWLGRFLAACALYVLFFHDTKYAGALSFQHALALGALAWVCLSRIKSAPAETGPDKPSSH